MASYGGLLLGSSVSVWQSHVKQVEAILRDIEKSYVNTYNTHGNLKQQPFFTARKMHFRRLDTTLRRFLQPQFGGSLQAGDMRRNLGLSSKSMVHQWDQLGGSAAGIPGYSKHYAEMAKLARQLKRVGYVGVGLTAFEAGANIQHACTVEPDTPRCKKSKYTETGKATGSIIGGAAGGYIGGYLACNLVFGVETAGTSLFWCGVVLGGTGGYLGGKYGGAVGEWGGEVLYDTRVAP